MNRDELIEKVARRLAGDDGKVWWTNAIPAVYFDQARAVLPVIEADVRERIATEIEAFADRTRQAKEHALGPAYRQGGIDGLTFAAGIARGADND